MGLPARLKQLSGPQRIVFEALRKYTRFIESVPENNRLPRASVEDTVTVHLIAPSREAAELLFAAQYGGLAGLLYMNPICYIDHEVKFS